MVTLLGLVMALVVLVVVVWPLVYRREEGPTPLDALAWARARREAVYRELDALEMDFQMGQVSQEEFQARRQALLREAAEALREQERWEEVLARLEEEIEREVMARRRVRPQGEGHEGGGP